MTFDPMAVNELAQLFKEDRKAALEYAAQYDEHKREEEKK